jgi:hypothetical protein
MPNDQRDRTLDLRLGRVYFRASLYPVMGTTGPSPYRQAGQPLPSCARSTCTRRAHGRCVEGGQQVSCSAWRAESRQTYRRSGARSSFPLPSVRSSTGKPVSLIEPLRPHIRFERPQLKPARPPLPGKLEEPGAEPVARPCRVHVQLPTQSPSRNHQSQRRAVIGGREPRLMCLENTVHPLPNVIVRMHQGRNLRNSVMTSAQVYLGRNIRVSNCGPSQVWFGIHLPIVAPASSFCKTLCDGVLSCRRSGWLYRAWQRPCEPELRDCRSGHTLRRQAQAWCRHGFAQSGGRTSGLRHARAGRFSAARRRAASYQAHESVTGVACRGPRLPLRYGRHRLAAFEPQPGCDRAAGAGGQAG